MNKLKRFGSNPRTSFWFVPTLIVALSIVLAMALIETDYSGTQQWLARWPRLFGANAAGARGMLTTIAGSMMAVVGVTFSMTLVTLALASSQYTSRILRNFMRDRVTQVVLGIFAGIFTYCLIVLRTIRGGDTGGFVPSLAVTLGVVLAIGGIAALIFSFITSPLRSRPRASLPRLPTKPWRPSTGFFRRDLDKGRQTTMRIRPCSPCRCRTGRSSRSRKMVTSKAWIARRSCAWRGNTRPSCAWNAASACLWCTTHGACLARFAGSAGKTARRRPAGGIQHQPPPHAGTGCRLWHQTDRGHGVARALAQRRRHHDGSDVCGLSDGDSGAAGRPEHPFIASP